MRRSALGASHSVHRAHPLLPAAPFRYYSSLMVGPEHIDTSGGYFQLGNVFYSMNKIENALAMYDKVVDIW